MPKAHEVAFAAKLRFLLSKIRQVDCYCCLEDDVDPEEVPGYSDVIKFPMSFSAIERVSIASLQPGRRGACRCHPDEAFFGQMLTVLSRKLRHADDALLCQTGGES